MSTATKRCFSANIKRRVSASPHQSSLTRNVTSVNAKCYKPVGHFVAGARTPGIQRLDSELRALCAGAWPARGRARSYQSRPPATRRRPRSPPRDCRSSGSRSGHAGCRRSWRSTRRSSACPDDRPRRRCRSCRRTWEARWACSRPCGRLRRPPPGRRAGRAGSWRPWRRVERGEHRRRRAGLAVQALGGETASLELGFDIVGVPLHVRQGRGDVGNGEEGREVRKDRLLVRPAPGAHGVVRIGGRGGAGGERHNCG
jgi:hypothetical protein